MLLFLAALQIFTLVANAQEVEVEIRIDQDTRTANVSGRFGEGFRPENALNLTLKREVAGVPALGGRIGMIELADGQGKRVGVRNLMLGEYVAEGAYRSWRYKVDLTPPEDRAGFAHASWLGDSSGILMLDDLLPQFGTRTTVLRGGVKLSLPQGWNIHSSESSGLVSDDLSTTIIFVGKGHRVVNVRPAAAELQLLLNGQWHFTDDEAAEMAREIFGEYSKLLGSLPKKQYLIALQRFPGEHPHGQWEAETRGRTVTIFSSDMPFRTQSLQRLHEQLRHEIFHLWFPNGINLIGDYAWFYEGFAMYSSLRLAVKLNRIRFEDFLDTLSRAHTIDTNARPRKALTDASIEPTVRYARGMLIAFLTDLQILKNSGGKTDVGKSLKALFVDFPIMPNGSPASEGVKTVVTDPEMMRRYVDGVELVDWTAELAAAGIESKQAGRTTVTVAAKLNGRQKAILDRLGYNNWRKIGTRK